MNPKSELPESLGRPLNELDFDFGNFILTGWLVSLTSRSTYGSFAANTDWLLIRKNGVDFAAGLTFCITLRVITTDT